MLFPKCSLNPVDLLVLLCALILLHAVCNSWCLASETVTQFSALQHFFMWSTSLHWCPFGLSFCNIATKVISNNFDSNILQLFAVLCASAWCKHYTVIFVFLKKSDHVVSVYWALRCSYMALFDLITVSCCFLSASLFHWHSPLSWLSYVQ